MRRLALVAALAWRDLVHEARLFACTATGFAAVLAPLLVLFALKHGVIEGLRETLVQNPRARMVVNTANRGFDQQVLATLAARPDVAFVVPRTRTLNAPHCCHPCSRRPRMAAAVGLTQRHGP